MGQRQTSRTSHSARIAVDVSFVKTKLYDHYDELTEATTLQSVTRILNRAFTKRDINFKVDPNQYQELHSKSYKVVGIAEGETISDGTINIYLWSEVLYTLSDDSRFERFVSLLSAVIRHELVHREQTIRSRTMCHQQEQKRSHQKMPEWQKYYNDRHEQIAMAHEIVENWKQSKLPTKQVLEQLCNKRSPLLSKHSMRFYESSDIFPKNDANRKQVIHRLKKLIYQVLCN